MSNRSSVRFIQKEKMKKDGVTRICSPQTKDGVNKKRRSFFAMHWRNYPNLDVIPILPRHGQPHTKRNQNAKKKETV